MAEPFFGSTQPWPSAPVFGYLQPPMAIGNRQFAPGTVPFGPFSPPMALPGLTSTATTQMPGIGSADPYLQRGSSPMTGIGVPAPGAGLSAVMAGPAWAGAQPTGAEIAVGVTAPALLAAIAMRRGQPLGPVSDLEIEDFICDALDLLPGSTEIEVRCEGGRATLTGTVPHKRLKRDAGEVAWAIPNVNDVQNNVTIAARRRSRPAREGESPVPTPGSGRK